MFRQSIKKLAARYEISLLATLEASTFDNLPNKTNPTRQSNNAIIEDESSDIPVALQEDSIPLDPKKY